MFIIKKKIEVLETSNKWICYLKDGRRIKVVITDFTAQGRFTKEFGQ